MEGEFLGERYLLSSRLAADLFAEVRGLPIIDAHNHADVAELDRNENYSDIWQVEASTDHYVWELLRKCGVPESHITGSGGNKEKWLTASAVFDDLAGNPTYEWVHLDLRGLFGIHEEIDKESGASIWDRSEAMLKTDEMKPQALIKRMNIEVMCSTDDPLDSLDSHIHLRETLGDGVVRPTFRPDRAMNIFKPDWSAYIEKFEKILKRKFAAVSDLVAALKERHDFFAECGCVASDHGVQIPYGYQVTEDEANTVFLKALQSGKISREEEICYMSYLLNALADMDAQKNWVFQLHIGPVRDVRDYLAKTIGPDSGGDISDHRVDIATPLIPLLNRFDSRLKIVLYCIDPYHTPTLATLARAFGPKVRVGSAWWFNDSPPGMKSQLEYLGAVDLLSSCVGMVSDSRKVMSYASRHEMFRRCLCETLGTMVAQGRIPFSVSLKLAKRIAYENAKSFFGF